MSKRLSIDDFSVTLDLPVQWGDMDAFQHVNNARFFRFFESARVFYLQATGLRDYFTGSSLSFILAKAGCTFIAPLTYPDTMTVGCRTVQITPSRLEQQYMIHSQKLETAAALGTATLVAYDYAANKRADFPSQLLETLCRHEGLHIEQEG
ncbi:MAG: thioesterase family protein [Desulfovermiculus sp.]